jgi:4-diphosphocytidyl-2-C-methyl-D-erythritol kinase
VIVRAVAPAKINWTLEVLGVRPDGYHEIRSVMQTIDLRDTVELSPAPELQRQHVDPPRDGPPGTLYAKVSHRHYYANHSPRPAGHGLILGETIIQATSLLDPESKRDVRTSLTKRIPVAAGLGGGSSDAAATLRGLDRLWELGLQPEELALLAGQIGSDVSFFLTGGTALAEGRGERITLLPDVPEMWLVVVAPPISMEEKTKRMYGALRDGDFSDGRRTEALAERLKRGEGVREEDMCNAFERAAYEFFEGLAAYRGRLLEAGAKVVRLAGAGPALFAMFDSREEADRVAAKLDAGEARIFVTRTLGASEATRMEVVRELESE